MKIKTDKYDFDSTLGKPKAVQKDGRSNEGSIGNVSFLSSGVIVDFCRFLALLSRFFTLRLFLRQHSPGDLACLPIASDARIQTTITDGNSKSS